MWFSGSMRKTLSIALLATMAGCATVETTQVNCRLWYVMPATHQRKFIHQGQFTDAAVERAPVASSDRDAIYKVCENAPPTLVLGRYYLWP